MTTAKKRPQWRSSAARRKAPKRPTSPEDIARKVAAYIDFMKPKGRKA